MSEGDNTVKPPTAHGGQGFNPFSVGPSVGIINQPNTERVPVDTTRGTFSTGASATTANDKKDEATLAILESEKRFIRSNETAALNASDTLASSESQLTANLSNSNKRVNELGGAVAEVSNRIPLQEASIAECERQLKEAEQSCNMAEADKHRAMLAVKRKVLAELQAALEQGNSKLTSEKSTHDAIENDKSQVGKGISISTSALGELDRQGGLVDGFIQSLSTTIGEPATNKNQAIQ